MQTTFGEFFEDINEALREAVRALGGHKKVGPQIYPELPLEQAANRLRDCLNPDRRDTLSPERVLLVLRLARQAGYHGAMSFIASDAGYESPRPLDAQDAEAALQSQFIEAVTRLEQLQKQLQRVGQLRKVG